MNKTNKGEEAGEKERLNLGVSSELMDITERTFELTVPETVIDFLKVKAGDELQFVLDESDKRIYVEKAEK